MQYISYNPLIGCVAGGISEGCMHCAALKTAAGNAIRHRISSPALSAAYRRALSSNGKMWSGEFSRNPRALANLARALPSERVMCGYMGEYGLLPPHILTGLLLDLEVLPYRFVVPTKLPERFHFPVSALSGRGNITIAASVELPKYLGRLDELRRIPDKVRKEAWIKPALGIWSGVSVDFSGMDDVEISGETGKYARHTDSVELLALGAQAIKAGIRPLIETVGEKTGNRLKRLVRCVH